MKRPVSQLIFRRGRKVRHMLRDMFALSLATSALLLATKDLEEWFSEMVATEVQG